EFVDIAIEWYNYGYRYYAPELGRWLSKDPIREDGDPNDLIFSLNSPMNFKDTLGLIVCCPEEQTSDDYRNCCESVKLYKDVNGHIKCGVAGTNEGDPFGGSSGGNDDCMDRC